MISCAPESFRYAGNTYSRFCEKTHMLCQKVDHQTGDFHWCFVDSDRVSEVPTTADPIYNIQAKVAELSLRSWMTIQDNVVVRRVIFATERASRLLSEQQLDWDIADTDVIDLWYNAEGYMICPCCKGTGKTSAKLHCLYCQTMKNDCWTTSMWTPLSSSKSSQMILEAPSRKLKKEYETETIDWNPAMDAWIQQGLNYEAALQRAKAQQLTFVPVLREISQQ